MVDGVYRSTVTIDGKTGAEVLGLPLAVQPNRHYVLSVEVAAPDFECYRTATGYFFGVMTKEPTSKNGCTGLPETLDPALVLNYTQIAPKFTGRITLEFDSGNYSTVYLALNGGYLADNQVVTFTFTDLRLRAV